MADEFSGHCLVINSPTQNNTDIAQYRAPAEQNRSLVTFWDINRHRDSVELRCYFLNAFPAALIHICRNLYFGTPENLSYVTGKNLGRLSIVKIERWIFSIWGTGWPTNCIWRMPIKKDLEELPTGDSAELRCWKTPRGNIPHCSQWGVAMDREATAVLEKLLERKLENEEKEYL